MSAVRAGARPGGSSSQTRRYSSLACSRAGGGHTGAALTGNSTVMLPTVQHPRNMQGGSCGAGGKNSDKLLISAFLRLPGKKVEEVVDIPPTRRRGLSWSAQPG